MSRALVFHYLFIAQHVSILVHPSSGACDLFVDLLLWFDVCWCYGVVRLGWCGIVMEAEAVLQPA
jgi:hypothetical protein